MTLVHKFVRSVPETLDEGVIYVSIDYATAIHKCCCGCGNEVVTPISPKDWKLIFDGETISLEPSIGNWSYKCQSHYFITRNRVEWCPKWDKAKPDTAQRKEAQVKKQNPNGGKPGLFRRLFKRK